MTMLAETEFAKKLARAPRTSLAAQIAEAERLVAAQHSPFFKQLLAMVDDIVAASHRRGEPDRAAIKSLASDIAGAGGLMGAPDVAQVASQLAQLADEMAETEWSWDAIGVFTQTLSLLTKSDESLTAEHKALLIEQLTHVRATLKTRAGRTGAPT
ncbi:MAG: Hpt domain-containing protein [Alphaproteobacteria bacterium]|nr:Hpt domain-containing protein [Alphaproteobacteria bacterium]